MLALCSITTADLTQHQLQGILNYLQKHAEHIDSIDLKGSEEGALVLQQLPQNLQVSSLQLSWFSLQLQSGAASKACWGLPPG